MRSYSLLTETQLAATFEIGVLFLVISPIPMGIGVVEGVMALVTISLGVPGEAATVITLAFRGLPFWLPFAISFMLLRQVKAFGAELYWRPLVRAGSGRHETCACQCLDVESPGSYWRARAGSIRQAVSTKRSSILCRKRQNSP